MPVTLQWLTEKKIYVHVDAPLLLSEQIAAADEILDLLERRVKLVQRPQLGRGKEAYRRQRRRGVARELVDPQRLMEPPYPLAFSRPVAPGHVMRAFFDRETLEHWVVECLVERRGSMSRDVPLRADGKDILPMMNPFQVRSYLGWTQSQLDKWLPLFRGLTKPVGTFSVPVQVRTRMLMDDIGNPQYPFLRSIA